MPVPMNIGRVTIFVFLDLEQNFSFLDGHYLVNMSRNPCTVRRNVIVFPHYYLSGRLITSFFRCFLAGNGVIVMERQDVSGRI